MNWILCMCLSAVQFTVLSAAKLERYVIPEVDQCNSHFREISGAVVTSARAIPLQYQDSSCYLKFTADGTIATRKRLMLKFTELRIDDKRVEFTIYDGRSQLSMVLHEFTKGAKPPLNISVSSSNFFTLKLDLNGAPTRSFAFTMLVTAFESRGSNFCADFMCDNDYCISKDLVCDNVDSCFDGSDETSGPPGNCKPGVKRATQTVQKWVIGLIVVISIVLVAIIAICVFCCLRRSKTGRDNSSTSPPSPSGGPSTTVTTAYHVAPTTDSNGTQGYNTFRPTSSAPLYPVHTGGVKGAEGRPPPYTPRLPDQYNNREVQY